PPIGVNSANQTFTPSGSDANLTFVAAAPGSFGNDIYIQFVKSGSVAACSRSDMTITINYPSAGVSANDIADAVTNTIDCSILVSASTSGDDVDQDYNSWEVLAGSLVNGSDGNTLDLSSDDQDLTY